MHWTHFSEWFKLGLKKVLQLEFKLFICHLASASLRGKDRSPQRQQHSAWWTPCWLQQESVSGSSLKGNTEIQTKCSKCKVEHAFLFFSSKQKEKLLPYTNTLAVAQECSVLLDPLWKWVNCEYIKNIQCAGWLLISNQEHYFVLESGWDIRTEIMLLTTNSKYKKHVISYVSANSYRLS